MAPWGTRLPADRRRDRERRQRQAIRDRRRRIEEIRPRVFVHKGEDYSYNIMAQFHDTEGTGTRDAGLGIVGRPCTFDSVKQYANFIR
jgi:hypothetical protein